jgi:glycosyltransferase involved in cell wall biosynthesis
MVGPEKDGSLQKCKDYAEKHDLKVIFTGKLKKKEWAKVSADYDIFLNSTNIDNTPISVIEAMALGLAIVSTDVGGMKDLIDHQENGILVPWKDERSMVKAIKSLLEDQERTAQMTLNAREKVSNFDWEKVKDNWNELLH